MTTFPFPPAQPPGDWSVRLPGTASIGEVLVYATSIPTGDFYRWTMSGSDFPILEASGFGHTADALTGHASRTAFWDGPSLRADAVGSSFRAYVFAPPDATVLWTPPIAKTSNDVAIAALIRSVDTLFGTPYIAVQANGMIRMLRTFYGPDGHRFHVQYWTAAGWQDLGMVPIPAVMDPPHSFCAMRIVGDTVSVWLDETVTSFTINPATMPAYAPASTWSIETSQNDGAYWIQDVTFWPNGADDAAIQQVANELAGLF